MSCEWNKLENRECYADEESHAEATVCLGDNEELHLCKPCSKLPRFSKYKKKPIPQEVVVCETYYSGKIAKCMPTTTGLYTYRCDETEREWYHIAVFRDKVDGVLFAVEEGLGKTELRHFHENLCDIEWFKVA